MAAYDNVSLPGPPDIAHAGNYAQMLMQGLSGLGDAYQSGKDFRYKQRQQDLFQDPDSQAMLQDALKSGNYAPVMQKIIQAQGASAAPAIGQLMSDQAGARLADAIGGGGGTPQQPNTSRTGQTAAALDKASARTGGAPSNPRIPYSGSDQPSATDNAGGETVRTLTAGIANGRQVQEPTIANYARALGIDPDTPLSAEQEARARKIIGNNLGGVSGQSSPPATNDAASGGSPINSAAAPQGNESPAVGSGGGSPISPAPTTAAGGGAFNDRFGAATGGAPQPSGPQVAQAATRPTPVGTEAQAQQAETRAKNMRALQAYYAGRNPKAAEAIGARAAEEEKRAHEIRDSIGKYNEPTPEQKNVETGAEERKGQIAADTKYYDSLHRGLAGSGMIAAQQKQNVDLLRQVAASPSFTPGAGSELAQGYQRLAAQFGINPTGAAPREIFNQVAARILADQFSGMKSMAAETGESGGRLFKSMLDIEEKANITPQDTLEGVKAKLDIIQPTGDPMMRWADKADDYKNKHRKLDAGVCKDRP